MNYISKEHIKIYEENIYDVVVNDANSINNIIQKTHFPGKEKPEIILPVKSKKDLYFDLKIMHTN